MQLDSIASHSFVRVVRREVTHWKGWTIKGSQINHAQGFLYRIKHPSQGVFEGTQQQLVDKIEAVATSVWRLVRGDAHAIKGWTLEARYIEGHWVPFQQRPKNVRPPHTQETKRKIGDAKKGRTASAETRVRMSLAHLGKKMPEGTGAKLSAAKKGRPSPLKGRRLGSQPKKAVAGRQRAASRRLKEFELRRVVFENHNLPIRPLRTMTEASVCSMLDSGDSAVSIARHFRVHPSTIYRIKAQKRPKLRLSKTRPGSEHPRYDRKIYSFVHDNGREFVGTQWEFRMLTGMSSPHLAALLKQRQRTAHGWHVVWPKGLARPRKLPPTAKAAA
jgi:hypothetical protein